MRIIGIDPGTAICGYGIIDVKGSKLTPVAYGAITTPKELTDQVIYMTMNILGIREKIKPDDTADALAVAICTAHSSHNDRLKRLV